MEHLSYFDKVKTLKSLIERNRAQTIHEIAKKLKVSKRTVHLMVHYAVDSGVQITYCKKSKLYNIICKN